LSPENYAGVPHHPQEVALPSLIIGIFYLSFSPYQSGEKRVHAGMQGIISYLLPLFYD